MLQSEISIVAAGLPSFLTPIRRIRNSALLNDFACEIIPQRKISVSNWQRQLELSFFIPNGCHQIFTKW